VLAKSLAAAEVGSWKFCRREKQQAALEFDSWPALGLGLSCDCIDSDGRVFGVVSGIEGQPAS
jgi:hypothetical protein